MFESVRKDYEDRWLIV